MARKDKAPNIDTGSYDYGVTRVEGKGGKTVRSIGNGDAVQRALLKFYAAGKDIGQVIRANKLKQDPAQYDNAGLLRMSVGNSLRALVRNGTHVTIGDVTVKSLEQRVALDEVKDPGEKKARAPRKRKNEAAAEAA